MSFVIDKDYKIMGGVLVVKKRAGLTREQMQQIAGEFLSKSDMTDALVIYVEKLSDIKRLDQELMRQHGWVRQHDILTDSETRLITYMLSNVYEECEDDECRGVVVDVARKLGVKYEND